MFSWCWVTCALGGVPLALGVLYVICRCIVPRAKHFRLVNSHVLVTGASRGIGKSLATEAVLAGAHVTLVARNPTLLEQVSKELQSLLSPSSTINVTWFAVDLVHATEQELQDIVQAAEDRVGRPVDVLVNNCGGSVTAPFDEISLSQFHDQVKLNYLTGVGMTKAVTPSMKRNRNGRIVFVSSMAGQIGLYGYTAYSGSKFALRGFCEALQMELYPYNIWVTLGFPPNTDTDGLKAEMESMPVETQLISGTAGVWKPQTIARKLLKDACAGKTFSYFGTDGWMLACLTAGMSTTTSAFEAVQQIFTAGLFRFIGLFYLGSFYSIVKKENKHVKKQN